VPRIARWWLQIMDYDIEVEHRSGEEMSHVDALSRNLNVKEEVSRRNQKVSMYY